MPTIRRRKNANNKSYYLSTTSKVLLGIAGTGAGLLYYEPGKTCATSQTCGAWLSHYITEKGATIIYTLGGLDFALINAYFSSRCISEFSAYMQQIKSYVARAIISGLIFLFAVSQAIQILIASVTANNGLWQTTLTVLGTIPGSLFSAVNMMRHELPILFSGAKRLATKVWAPITDCFVAPTAEIQQYRVTKTNYDNQYKQFMERIEMRWQTISAYPEIACNNPTLKPRDFLLNASIPSTLLSTTHSGMQWLGWGIGIAVAAIISAPFAMNTYNFLNGYIPTSFLTSLTAGFLVSAPTYGNYEVCTKGFMNVLGGLADIVSGNPIRSLAFHLRPKTNSFALGLSILFSIFSYSVLDFIFKQQFQDEKSDLREGMRYTTDVSICIYHIFGLFHFANLMLRATSKNPDHQYAFAVEQEYENIKRMTREEVIERFIKPRASEMTPLLAGRTFLNEGNAQPDKTSQTASPSARPF